MLPLALVVVILGGTGSLLGSLVGSFVVGFLYNFGQAMFPELAYVVLFLPMLIVLVVRPAGPVRQGRRYEAPGALAAALAVLATLPLWVGNTYYVNIASQILLYAIFALGLNVLVGYAGLVIARPRRAVRHRGLCRRPDPDNGGHGHLAVDRGRAGSSRSAAAALFAVLALRGTGLGFVMITVALGQIVWGIAYRWISLTNGDNGISITGAAGPFGLSLASPPAFYWATLVVFLRRRRLRWRSSSPRRSAPACAARATSRGA